MKELIGSNIPPVYFSFLNEAHHCIYCALEEMTHTNCATPSEVKRLIEIYDDLGDFMNKIQEEEK